MHEPYVLPRSTAIPTTHKFNREKERTTKKDYRENVLTRSETDASFHDIQNTN